MRPLQKNLKLKQQKKEIDNLNGSTFTTEIESMMNSFPQDFPGSPVVKTLPSNAGGVGSIPGQGANIPHASGPKNQNIKQKQYCNNFNKDIKNSPHPGT